MEKAKSFDEFTKEIRKIEEAQDMELTTKRRVTFQEHEARSGKIKKESEMKVLDLIHSMISMTHKEAQKTIRLGDDMQENANMQHDINV